MAYFERKGWPLHPYCFQCSFKAKTAAAQRKRLGRQCAADSVEQRRSLGGDPQCKAGTAAPVSTVKKKKKKRLNDERAERNR